MDESRALLGLCQYHGLINILDSSRSSGCELRKICTFCAYLSFLSSPGVAWG